MAHNNGDSALIDLDPSDPRLTPAAFLRNRLSSESGDPASRIDGMAPNFGRPVIPHIVSFQSLVGSGRKVYRDYDEATKASLDNARFMRNDCGIMECIESRQRCVALLDWHLEPEDEKSQEQVELCTALTKILNRIRLFTEYRYNLMSAIWYGKYAVQNRYGWETIGGKQYQIPIGGHADDWGWKPIHGDKLVFRYDDGNLPAGAYENQLGVRVGATYAAGDLLAGRWRVEMADRSMAYFLSPWERRLVTVHRHLIEDAAFEDAISAGSINGVGIRSRIYWEWVQKQETLAFLMEYLERSAGGIEMWKYPMGNVTAKAETERAARERLGGARNVVMIPMPMDDTGQYGLQVIEPGMAGIETVHQLLTEYFGHRIKRYILGQTLTSEAAATGLGSGVAEAHKDTFMQIVRFDAMKLQETLTHELVRHVKDFNFPKAKHFHVELKIDVEEEDVKEKLESYQMAYNMGCSLKERDVMDMIGAAIPGADDKVLKQQDPAMQAGAMPGSGGVAPAASMTTQQFEQAFNKKDPGDDPASGGDTPPGSGPVSPGDAGPRVKVGEYARNFSEQPRDENGRWMKSSIEVESSIYDAEPGKDFREKAIQWGRSNLVGKKFINTSTGMEIGVSRRSVLKTVSHLPDKRPALSLSRLPELLESAALDRTEANSDPADHNIRQWHYLKADLTIDGIDHVSTLKIREAGSGTLYYDQHVVERKDVNPPFKPGVTDESATAQAGGSTESSIDPPGDEVNQELYARRKPSSHQKQLIGDQQHELRWITLHGHGGSVHVQVDDSGVIHAGPAALADKGIHKLSDFGKKEKPEGADETPTKAAKARKIGGEHQPGLFEPDEELGGQKRFDLLVEADPADSSDDVQADEGVSETTDESGSESTTAASLFDDAIGNGDTPREAAQSSMQHDSDYEFARKSEIPNVGEDLKFSARHKANAWRGLAAAEADGSAEIMVTRDNLLKAEPHSLMVHADSHPVTSLAMHLAIKSFPSKPGYGTEQRMSKRTEDQKAKDRSDFLEAYRSIKGKAEELAEQKEDPVKALGSLRSHVVGLIGTLRAADRVSNTANALINMANRLGTSSWDIRKSTSIAHTIGEFSKRVFTKHSDGDKDVIVAGVIHHAKNMIEGMSMPAAFGEKSEGKKRKEAFNPAELYVGHAERSGGRDLGTSVATPNKAAKTMVDDFGLRGVQWGNSVTDDEREHHAKRAAEALVDLAEVLELSPKDISLGGKLGLAIGARGVGNALAHYEPSTTVINLTRKNGIGSLAHEWGHGFDHFLHDFKGWNSEESDRYGAEKHENAVVKAGADLRKAWQSSGYYRRMRDTLQEMINNNQISAKKANDYWSSAKEVFARTFERHVQRKLERDGRKNTYLAGISSKSWKSGGLWPTDDETDAMSPSFDALFAAFREKSPNKEKYSRSELIQYFRDQQTVANPLVSAFEAALSSKG